ncbi:two-component sensor histidine kinase [Clostridia bacterium]|nr:two-component sensor histidine kinase [Clostridia bacterium]
MKMSVEDMSKEIDAARDRKVRLTGKQKRQARNAVKRNPKPPTDEGVSSHTAAEPTDRRHERHVKPAPHHTKPAPDVVFNDLSANVYRVSARIAGSLRFSIKLRIALSHVLLLGRKVFLAAFLIVAAVALMHMGTYKARFEEGLNAITAMESGDIDQSDWSDTGVDVVWLGVDDRDANTDYYSDADVSSTVNAYRLPLPKGWGIEFSPVNNNPDRPELSDVFVISARGDYEMRLNMRESTIILAWCGFALAVYWVVGSMAMLNEGQGVSARLLAPITYIANTAEQLSEQNLSMRINVAGTQNELRNLAMMVNGMLDRIESAYNRQKQFVSDASHELRTPIAVLQGYADLLARWGKDAPDVRDESIQAIQNETRSMKELVENLLYLARHDKGTLKLNPEPFSSVELIQETVRETALIARGHHIETGGLEDCTLTADRSAIKQALRIFVDNAVKYTPTGGYVSLSCRVEDRMCSITVRDTGVGISKQDLPRIFDRFYRADSSRNTQAGGHGLGLSIARIIVTSHGGKLHVKSKPGSGSAFTIALPLKR